jgi:multidrug resistance efflux pump
LQYLPSALKDTGKRQLDCLGIATAVLAACHMAAAQWPDAHRELAHARMMMSDDHCWIALPQQHAAAPAAAAAGAAAAAAAAAAADAGHGSAAGQQQQLVHVEVTDPRELAASQLCNTWLYAGGHGLAASPAQVGAAVHAGWLACVCVCVCVCVVVCAALQLLAVLTACITRWCWCWWLG